MSSNELFGLGQFCVRSPHHIARSRPVLAVGAKNLYRIIKLRCAQVESLAFNYGWKIHGVSDAAKRN
jgi:hypothetical protein